MYGEKSIFSNHNFYGVNLIEWHSTPHSALVNIFWTQNYKNYSVTA